MEADYRAAPDHRHVLITVWEAFLHPLRRRASASLEAPVPLPSSGPILAAETGWRQGLSSWSWAYLAALRRNPWMLHIPITAPPITPNQIAWLEEGLTRLRDHAIAENEKVSVIMLLSGFVRN